ncbi:MAG: DUF2889 domain-containing protein [Acidimicrobiales bacterium]
MTTRPSATTGPTPLHRRVMEFEAYESDPGLLVIGRLRDERPWAEGTSGPSTVHDMELRVTVRTDDMVVVEAVARMHSFPHAECPMIVEAFAGLAGLSVSRGFTRRVQERLGGPRGCSHLEQLARALGPVVIQAVTSRRALAMSRGELRDLSSGTGSPWATNSCHVWAEGGVAEQKLAAGWRPGTGPYPSRPLEAIRRSGGPP